MIWKYAFGFLSVYLAYIMDSSKLAVIVVVVLVIFTTVVKVAVALLYEFS